MKILLTLLLFTTCEFFYGQSTIFENYKKAESLLNNGNLIEA